VTEPRRRLVERVSDPSFARGLDQRSIEELRAMRSESKEGENELSFERRLCQARMDILRAELRRRSGEGQGSEDLLERLPQILAGEAGGGAERLPERAPDYSIPRNADVPRRRIEEIVGEQTLARLTTLGTEEIEQILVTLTDHERTVSVRRRAVQEVMDLIQAEIVRRYQTGEADPTSALTRE
jgi:hypothetical protein